MKRQRVRRKNNANERRERECVPISAIGHDGKMQDPNKEQRREGGSKQWNETKVKSIHHYPAEKETLDQSQIQRLPRGHCASASAVKKAWSRKKKKNKKKKKKKKNSKENQKKKTRHDEISSCH